MNSHTEPLDISQIRKVTAETTGDYWEFDDDSELPISSLAVFESDEGLGVLDAEVTLEHGCFTREQIAANLRFAAMARSAVPALCDRVESLEESLADERVAHRATHVDLEAKMHRMVGDLQREREKSHADVGSLQFEIEEMHLALNAERADREQEREKIHALIMAEFKDASDANEKRSMERFARIVLGMAEMFADMGDDERAATSQQR